MSGQPEEDNMGKRKFADELLTFLEGRMESLKLKMVSLLHNLKNMLALPYPKLEDNVNQVELKCALASLEVRPKDVEGLQLSTYPKLEDNIINEELISFDTRLMLIQESLGTLEQELVLLEQCIQNLRDFCFDLDDGEYDKPMKPTS